MANIGYATLSVIPSFQDFGRRLTTGMASDVQRAGGKAGTQFADSFERQAKSSTVSGSELGPSSGDMQRQGSRAGGAFGDEFESKAKAAADDASRAMASQLESNTSRFEAAGSSMAGGLAGKLKGGLAAAGVAAGAALMAGVAGSMDKEKVGDRLAAQLGAGGKNADRYGRVAGSLYAGAWGESLGEVSDSVANVVTNIGGMRRATNRELKGITATVLDIAGAFDQDSAAITRAADQLVRTGMAKNAKQALDIITRGFQGGANEADDLLDTYTEYGTQFRKLGLDGKAATGLLTQGLQAGARDADIVADTFKEFGIRAVDGSDTTRKGFQNLGLDAGKMADKVAKGGQSAADATDTVLDRLSSMKDPAKRAQTAVMLFGTQAEDMGDALFKLDPSKAVDTLGKVGGAAKRMGDTLNDNASTRIESFKRTIKGAMVDYIGNKVLPGLQRFGGYLQDKFGPAFAKIGGWIKNKLMPALGKLKDDYLVGLKGAFSNVGDAIERNKPFFQVLGEIARRFGTALIEKVLPALGRFYRWVGPKLGTAVGIGIDALKGIMSAQLRMVEIGARAFRGLFRAATFAFGKILDAAAAGLGWIPGLGDKIKAANEDFDSMRDVADNVLGKIADGAKNMREQINKPAKVKVEDRKARRQLEELQELGKLRIRMLAPSSGRNAPGVQRFASGGKIGGSGSGTSDSNLLWGSKGEWMIRARAARHYGDAFMSAVNNLQLPKMAGGGPVAGGGGGVNFNGPITVVAHDYGDFMSQMQRRTRQANAGGVKF